MDYAKFPNSRTARYSFKCMLNFIVTVPLQTVLVLPVQQTFPQLSPGGATEPPVTMETVLPDDHHYESLHSDTYEYLDL